MKNSIQLASFDDCTGCGVCASICPQKCITMAEGFQGHLYPKADGNTCLDCGLCEKQCAALHPDNLKPILKAYAVWTKDATDYKTTASGGVATALSKYVISQDGVVYGCALLPDVEVRHVRVDSIDKVGLLKSSKYVQSSLMEIYPAIKEEVSSGRMVLFIGTPCQVAAIKKLFPKEPDNLFLVDLICHGVPSLQSLKEHVKKVAHRKHVAKVIFRENGNFFVLAVYDEDERLLYRMPLWSERYRDWYMNTFIDGYTYRDSCYRCKYARPERISDLTIGDFWGLHDNTNEIPAHEYGCSVALPITNKGTMLIEAIKPSINIYEREVQEAVDGNSQLRHPSKLTKRVRVYRKAQKLVKSPWVYYWVNMDRIVKLYYVKMKNRITTNKKR